MAEMEILRLTLGVESLTNRGTTIEIAETMVDTGSEYTWIPRSVLREDARDLVRMRHDL